MRPIQGRLESIGFLDVIGEVIKALANRAFAGRDGSKNERMGYCVNALTIRYCAMDMSLSFTIAEAK